MTVYFCNSEPIDLSAIAVMGVSVKLGENPIGYFGTGLKFSIATLLRTGHQVRLIRRKGDERTDIRFTSRGEIIRGEEFQRVFMEFNGGSAWDALGFTTQLGRNWEPWQAYRELHCNCTDESGVISDKMPEGDWGTVFAVDGDAIANCHRNRREIFLEGTPISATNECEIHAGSTMDAFYRGVRAHKHQQQALFTYNIIDQTDLTEDRTIKNGWEVEYYASRAIAASDDEALIEEAVLAPRGMFESGLGYAAISCKPSLAFMDVLFRHRNNHHANLNAVKLWEKHTDAKLTFTEVATDAFEEAQIAKAIALVARLGVKIERSEFFIVEGLGKSVYGVVRRGQILIAKATIDLGPRFIASTLYEEYLHKTEDLRDATRELQNVLFEKLFATVERLQAVEDMLKTK